MFTDGIAHSDAVILLQATAVLVSANYVVVTANLFRMLRVNCLCLMREVGVSVKAGSTFVGVFVLTIDSVLRC